MTRQHRYDFMDSKPRWSEVLFWDAAAAMVAVAVAAWATAKAAAAASAWDAAAASAAAWDEQSIKLQKIVFGEAMECEVER